MTTTAIVLSAHGSPHTLQDLPAFLRNVRRGRPAPPELLDEVRRRYELIGGQSPLLAISQRLAEKLEARVQNPVRVAMRLWSPLASDVVSALVQQGVQTLVSLPLAPYSVHVYHPMMRTAVEALGATVTLLECPAWNMEPTYLAALGAVLSAALEQQTSPARTAVIFSAHSLPTRVVAAGDPYAALFEQTATALARSELVPRGLAWRLAYQSQGASEGPWLGPDLLETFRALHAEGIERVMVMPIGFPTDHIEVLYDLDIEARMQAESLGLSFVRTPTLNDSNAMVDTLEAVVRGVLLRAGG